MSNLYFLINILLSFFFALIAAFMLLIYYFGAHRVAQENVHKDAALRQRVPHMKRLLRETERRLAALGVPENAAEPPELDGAWRQLCYVRSTLAQLDLPDDSFLPSFSSDTAALRHFVRQPRDLPRFVSTATGLSRLAQSVDQAGAALDAARCAADELEGLPNRLRQGWRKLRDQVDELAPRLQEEMGFFQACASRLQRQRIEIEKALNHLKESLDSGQPIDDGTRLALQALGSELQGLAESLDTYSDERFEFDERRGLVTLALNRGLQENGQAPPLPDAFRAAIRAMVDQADDRSAACDFGAGIAWLAVAEGWLGVVLPLAQARQAMTAVQRLRHRTLDQDAVAALASRWSAVDGAIHSRLLELTSGRVPEPDGSVALRRKAELDHLLRDLRLFYRRYTAERLQTRDAFDSALQELAAAQETFASTGLRDGDLVRSIDVMRTQAQMAAADPRRLATLANDAMHMTRVLTAQHDSFQSRRRRAVRIMNALPQLHGKALAQARKWRCLKPLFKELSTRVTEIEHAWATAERRESYDTVSAALDAIEQLDRQVAATAAQIDAEHEALDLQTLRITRGLLHIKKYLEPRNPARIRPQVAYVGQQLQLAHGAAEPALARDELQRVLTLVDEIVTHFDNAHDGFSGAA